MSGQPTPVARLPPPRLAFTLIEFLLAAVVIVAVIALLLTAVGTVADATNPPGKDEPAVDERVKALIAVLSKSDANEDVEGTGKAIAELARIGPPAVPHLVKVITEAEPKDIGTVRGNGPAYSALALEEIGKPAVEFVRKEWDQLDERARWKLMRFRGKHDYAASLDFALVSLDSKSDEVVAQAVRYLGQYKEPKAREPLLKKLNTAAPRVRWEVLDALTQISGEGVTDAFIGLLKKDSWAAKGEGQLSPPGGVPPWWPDGRPRVIEGLRTLRAGKAIPAAVAVLQERGQGAAYLGSFIIPFLGDFGGPECLPELKRIAAQPDGDIAPSLDTPTGIKSKAIKAVRAIESRTR
jgi:HEAT repeats